MSVVCILTYSNGSVEAFELASCSSGIRTV